ncbi:sensor histidine kinase [Roseococcus suduntuyensis]|uniref:histidine kinase n=1 Tax=Roseococcus suduntuyensis TaxID=455361 RepID=A0A840A8A3_9PROT|nr:sensor histidine kinase KdpD [Roseococcus suduntuyensis]MBB3896733.1 two-component system sensor histidine kinase KdpD [Roseococcus suduntuyensis]
MPNTRDPDRPDPDALLALAAREGRGRLKVFLGAAPGVGKTHEMLAEARRRLAGGADVLAGIIETHGRAETIAQVGDLPILPRARLEHRGQVLEEFDLDAALARRPQILLLDELAHSNAPGSRHPKRWQDVEELRDAGIEVWTTMNVQHLESLSDAVARIAGIRVAETVPDAVLAGADAVELIDIPPAELLERMRQGKIYRPDQAARAMRGFFREGNLAALREMALRRTAERVDADVTGYMRANAIAGPWPAGDRVLALVGADASAETVVRQGRRIADALRAPLVVLHVERPGTLDATDPTPILRMAEALGAEVETVAATDLPSTILAQARARNASHIVIGRGQPGFGRRWLGRTLSATLARRATDFTLHIVPGPAGKARAVPTAPAALPRWLGWCAVPATIALVVTLGYGAEGLLPERTLGMVFLAVVVALAALLGPWHAAAGAALGFLSWNFFFLEPRYTFELFDGADLVGLGAFAAVALLLAGTTGRLGRSVRTARARMLALRRLVEFSRRLGGPGGLPDLLPAVAEEATRVAGAPSAVVMPLEPLLPGAAPEPVVRAAMPVTMELDETAMAAARWALAQSRPAGRDTDTLPTAAWQFRPMRTARGVVGLVGVKLDDRAEPLAGETDKALTALLDQAAVAIERAQLMEREARGAARAETEQLRTALLTSLGHDLRTPLTSIRGALGTLRASGDALSADTRADLLLAAEEETARLSRYLSNILDMVRIEHGQVEPRREAVNIPEALEVAVGRARRATGREIAVTAGERLPEPRLDPALLDQILGNVLDNALKFSEAPVRVAARREGHEVAIAVEDDGPGIPAGDLHRVFDPFFRVTRTDRVAAGTGLGLAICRGLAHAMGGRIAAESPIRPAGGGTRITLRFPA